MLEFDSAYAQGFRNGQIDAENGTPIECAWHNRAPELWPQGVSEDCTEYIRGYRAGFEAPRTEDTDASL